MVYLLQIAVIVFLMGVSGIVLANILAPQTRLRVAQRQLNEDPMSNFLETLSTENKFRVLTSVDCSTYHLNCSTDKNCISRCASGPVSFRCHETRKLCVPIEMGKSEIDIRRPPECDPKRGIIAVLRPHNLNNNVNWTCISLYRDFLDDYGKNMNSVCYGGTLNIDVTKRAPSYLDCQCPSGTTRMVAIDEGNIPYCLKHSWLYRKSFREV